MKPENEVVVSGTAEYPRSADAFTNFVQTGLSLSTLTVRPARGAYTSEKHQRIALEAFLAAIH